MRRWRWRLLLLLVIDAATSAAGRTTCRRPPAAAADEPRRGGRCLLVKRPPPALGVLATAVQPMFACSATRAARPGARLGHLQVHVGGPLRSAWKSTGTERAGRRRAARGRRSACAWRAPRRPAAGRQWTSRGGGAVRIVALGERAAGVRARTELLAELASPGVPLNQGVWRGGRYAPQVCHHSTAQAAAACQAAGCRLRLRRDACRTTRSAALRRCCVSSYVACTSSSHCSISDHLTICSPTSVNIGAAGKKEESRDALQDGQPDGGSHLVPFYNDLRRSGCDTYDGAVQQTLPLSVLAMRLVQGAEDRWHQPPASCSAMRVVRRLRPT